MIVPGSANPLLIDAPSGYQISRSVRFRSSASAYFNRTPSSASNRQTWTWSGWVKRGVLGSQQDLFCGDSSTNITEINIGNDDTLKFWQNGTTLARQSTAVFRDPSAWYHIVVVLDTTNATAQNRCRMYVNGVEITTWTTNNTITQNSQFGINTATAHNLGRSTSAVIYFDGYMTEVNFIDGQALTPTSFGAFDAVTGVWNPKKYSGTYGTNGFYLNFSDNSSNTATTIGKDYSGNGNNWTPNNISVTAGTTYDSMVDSPTNYGTDTGAGGEVRGNYCTLNPLDSRNVTVSNGNLQVTYATAAWSGARATMPIPKTGKWKWEVTPTTMTYGFLAVAMASADLTTSGYTATNVFCWYFDSGEVRYSNNNVATGKTVSVNDVCEVQIDNGAVSFYKNGTLQHTFTQTLNDITADYFPAAWIQSGAVHVYNFGQRPFTYTVSGFKALCTQNLPTPTVSNGANYMAASLYTGTGASQTVSNAVNSISFQPDWVWIKSRSAATDNKLTDSVRGTTKALISNTTGAETTDTNGLTAFGSSGFTVGTDTVYNNSGATYVGWQWKASGSTVSNTAGSITSTVNANTTAGFSILTYTGTGATATIGHGLGATPSMMIMKKRSNAGSWKMYHTSIGNTQIVEVNDTGAAQTSSTYWNNTSPTSTLITVGSNGDINASTETYVSYCFAPITGYSAFGSYTGNGSTDGPFVYCGFRPRWLIIKRTDGVDSWVIEDSSRDTYNVNTKYLLADSSTSEGTATPSQLRDFLSNGFKARSANQNASGGTYIYAAFAENPFTLARAR